MNQSQTQQLEEMHATLVRAIAAKYNLERYLVVIRRTAATATSPPIVGGLCICGRRRKPNLLHGGGVQFWFAASGATFW